MYLVEWDIRDGDNEYRALVIAKIKNHEERQCNSYFRKVLEEYYFSNAYLEWPDTGGFEIDGDYRISTLSSITRLSDKQVDVLTELFIAQKINI